MTSTRERLVAFYREHNPVKINDIDVILETFAGREEEMMEALFAKYNVISKESVASREDEKKGHDCISNDQEVVNEEINNTQYKNVIVNESDSNLSTHDKMAKLIESMSAIDLVLLEERISTLLHSEFDEQTRHDVLWHTTRYLCYFLQCAEQFYKLTTQNEKFKLEQKEHLNYWKETSRNCISVQTEQVAIVESATQTDIFKQEKEVEQKEHFDAGTQTQLLNNELNNEQTELRKLTFNMAVNTSSISSSVVFPTHGHNYKKYDNNLQEQHFRCTISNREEEQVSIDSNNNNKENKQLSKASLSIFVNPTSNKKSYNSEINVQKVEKSFINDIKEKSTPVLLQPRCINTQHTTKRPTNLIVEKKEQNNYKTPVHQLKTITLTFSPPSQEKDSVIVSKLQEILPLSCNITLVLNPGVYYENLEFIAEMISERQTQEHTNELKTKSNNNEKITINITSAFPGAMVVIKPCHTFAPALSIKGNVHVIIRSIMFVGYDNNITVNKLTPQCNSSHDKINKTEVAPLIYIGNGSHVLMEGCHVYSNSGGGIVLKCRDNNNNNNKSYLVKNREWCSQTSEQTLLTELECRLCLFTKCGFAGLFALGSSGIPYSLCHVTCTHCEFTLCEVGLHIHSALVTLHKCLVEHCAQDGMVIHGNGNYNNNNNNNNNKDNLSLLGTSREHVINSKTPVFALTECVLSHNANNGILIGFSAMVEIVQCVIEENACYGIERFTGCTLHIDKCVIRNNGIAPVSTSFDDIEESEESSDTSSRSSNNSREYEKHIVQESKTLDHC